MLMGNGGFPAFFMGRVASVFGRQMFSVAVGWDLYDRTRSFLVLGFVGLAQIVPVVLLAIPGGNLSDRRDARAMGAVAAAAMALVALAFTVAAWVHAPVPVFFALLVAHGAVMALYAPSVGSLTPRLVLEEERPRANAVMSTGIELATIGGPAVAGALLLGNQAWPVYAVHLLTSLAFALTLLRLKARGQGEPIEAKSPASSDRKRDMLAGVRFVFSTPLLVGAMSLDLFAVLFGGVTALLPAFASDVLHVGSAGLGALRAAPAVGALLMATALTRRQSWKRPGLALVVSVVVFGLCTAGFALSSSFALSLVLLALAGAADNVGVVVRTTLEQMITPDHMRGRVAAVRFIFIGLSNELGEFESGIAAAALGLVPSVLFGSAVCLAVVGVVVTRVPDLLRLPPLAELGPRK